MNKLFKNGCEDGSIASLFTVKFKPVENFPDIIKALNSNYDGELLSFYSFEDKEVIVTGTTYLIDINDNLEYTCAEFMDKNNISDFIKNIVTEYERTIPLADFVELLIAPNQNVEIYLLDLKYGSTCYKAQT
jgi:hypothetical protein